jgi:hypothetical protein
MSEALKFQGRLAEKELEAKKLNLEAAGLISLVRDKLDPFEAVEYLEIEVAFQAMANLLSTVIELRATRNEIEAIHKALGS